MKRVINTTGYSTWRGSGIEITIQSGKLMYVENNSWIHKAVRKYKVLHKQVEIFGNTRAYNLNDRVHSEYGPSPIQVDEKEVCWRSEIIATPEECENFVLKYFKNNMTCLFMAK